MRSNFAKIIDSIVLLFATFILMFAWVRFYTHNLFISLAVGAITSILVCIIINHFLHKKEQSSIKTSTQKRVAESIAFNLLGATHSEVLDYLALTLKKENCNISRADNYLKREYYSAQKELHSTIIIPLFHKTKVDIDDIIPCLKLARTLNISNLEIYCATYSQEAANFIKKINNIHFTLYNQYELYGLLESPTPLKTLDTGTKKPSIMELLSFALNPKRAKNYLGFGILILICSMVVPFKIYYLVMGSILCITAAVVLLLPILKKAPK